MVTYLWIIYKMNAKSDPLTGCKHAITLLKELNLQREAGLFCDCVIQLQINPGKLFLAHKNVLAAASPVLASLLPRHGTLLDLQYPCISPETLDFLLEFIYTGTLPPQSQEDTVLFAAIHLQMEELKQALRCRQDAIYKHTEAAKTINKNRKRNFLEQHPVEGNPHSPYYSHGSEKASSPSCEVVPVICHASATITCPSLPWTYFQNRNLNIDFELNGKKSDVNKRTVEIPERGQLSSHVLQPNPLNEATFCESQSKRGKFLSVIAGSNDNELPRVVSEQATYHQCVSPRDFEEDELIFQSHADFSHENVFNQHSIHGCLHINTAVGNSDNKYNFDNKSGNAFNQSEYRYGEHASRHPRLQFGHIPPNSVDVKNTTHTDTHTLEDRRYYLFSQLTPKSHTGPQASLSLDASRGYCNEVKCAKNICDSNPWNDVVRFSAQNQVLADKNMMADISMATKVVIKGGTTCMPMKTNNNHKEEEDCDFFSLRKNDMHTYQGEVRYHCVPRESRHVAGSSDSDDDGQYTITTSTDVRDGGATIDERAHVASESDISPRRTPAGPGDFADAPLSVGMGATAQPYQCSVCERAFSQRGSLNRHVRSHLGVRPYSCPQCPMTFSRQYRVTEHMRVHQRGCEDLRRTGPT